MNFDPPQIEHINDVLPFIKDNSAFIVKDKGFYTVIDYLYMTDKLFHNPIERECRGIKFCSKTGRILARPYHKFHNLNERAGYRTEEVDLSRSNYFLLDKLDGSMVHTCQSTLGIYLMTRMGLTEVAEQADKFLVANQVRYGALLSTLGCEDYTWIFEYVGPNNRIVINYPEENLILTGIRHNINGTYVLYDEMETLCNAFKVPLVKSRYGGKKWPVDELEKRVKSDTEMEGVVIRFDTGAMVKMKADIYVRKHRTKELVSSQKGIVQLIVDNNIDDVLPQLDEEVQKKVVEYRDIVNERLSLEAACAKLVCDTSTHLSQKEFALKIKEEEKPIRHSILFNVRKGDNAWEAVRNLVRRNLSTNKKIIELFNQLSIPLWNFRFFKEE